MLAPRLDEVLAQTDPFDLAQALERHVDSLTAPRIHNLIESALPHMNQYYAGEFSRVNELEDEASLRTAFAQSLKSNLRAIALFGPSFGDAVLALTPAERAVGFADDPAPRATPMNWAAAALAIGALGAIAGAAGANAVYSARMQATTATAMPYVGVPPASVPLPRNRPLANRGVHARRDAARAVPAPIPVPVVAEHAPALQPQTQAAGGAAPPAFPAQAPTGPMRRAPRRTPQRAQRLPEAAGAAVIVTPPQPRATQTPETNAMDTSDMPQPYTDATALPSEAPLEATAPRVTRVSTPTPHPRRGGWLHRTIMHFDPFKPRPHPTP